MSARSSFLVGNPDQDPMRDWGVGFTDLSDVNPLDMPVRERDAVVMVQLQELEEVLHSYLHMYM